MCVHTSEVSTLKRSKGQIGFDVLRPLLECGESIAAEDADRLTSCRGRNA